jgi:hypothetical protein
MARRIAPEFNVTRIMRPVTAPVDTFYNLAPLAQTAPVDTQSLEIAEALRELSPSLMGMAQAMHSRETRLGVEDATSMTPEERKAFMKLEADKKGIMPQRTISTLQEIARQQYVMEYRRRALAQVPQMSEPYNPDGTIRTADSAMLTLQGIADGLNVPNSHYIRRAFLDGRRAVDNEIMARVAEGQVNRAQQRTEEQVVTRFMEIFQTTQDPEQIAKRFGEASDQLRQEGLLTDGGRRATYTALSASVAALAQSPRLEESDIDRISAVISTVMEPQFDEQGRAYRGVRGMPLPPELYAQYENLQNNLYDLYATAESRLQEAAIERHKFTALAQWDTFLDQKVGSYNPTPTERRQWLEAAVPNLSGAELAALAVSLGPAMDAAVQRRIQPPVGVDQVTFSNLESMAYRGELTPLSILQNPDLNQEQRGRLMKAVSEGPFSPALVQTEVARVGDEIGQLDWVPFDRSALSPDLRARLASRASALEGRFLRQLSRDISSNPDLMALRNSDPYDYADQIAGLLSRIPQQVREEMAEELQAAETESVERIRAAVFKEGGPQAKAYAAAIFAESVVPPNPVLAAEVEQKYLDTLYDEFRNDLRDFNSKVGFLTSDFHTQTVNRLLIERETSAIAAAPSSILVSPAMERSLNSFRNTEEQVEYNPTYQGAIFPDLPGGQGIFGRFFAPTPLYTANGFLKSTGVQDLAESVTDAYLVMEASGSVSDRNAWKQSQAALQQAVEAIDFQAQFRDLVVKARDETGTQVVKTISAPVFQFRPDGIYTLERYIDGVYNPTPSGQAFERAVAPLPERIASRLDDYRVKDPEAMAFYMSWKQRNFGSLDQLTNLQTDEGIVISRGIEDSGTIQFDPRKTRFFNSRQELEEVKAQYLSDTSGPLQVILEYTEYRLPPAALIQAQEDLIYMQIP